MDKKEIICHLCGGKALLRFEELPLMDGKAIICESPYYSCQKCKEEFSTSKHMQELVHLLN